MPFQADFSERCRSNLAGQQPSRLANWRLDHNLRSACEEEVPQICADQLEVRSPQVWWGLHVVSGVFSYISGYKRSS